MLGLARPTSGRALVFGHAYGDLPDAARRIGVSMGGIGAVPGATVQRDIRTWALMLGVGPRRCDEVLDLVELAAPNKKVTELSTGMRQRHGLAVALLADPELLVLDEPATGLDPDGIRWLRDTLRGLAAQGRTVLLSSHHLAEVAQTVDDVVILQRTLRYSGTLADLPRHQPDLALLDQNPDLTLTNSGAMSGVGAIVASFRPHREDPRHAKPHVRRHFVADFFRGK